MYRGRLNVFQVLRQQIHSFVSRKDIVNFESSYVDCNWIQEGDLSFTHSRMFQEGEGFLRVISRNGNEKILESL